MNRLRFVAAVCLLSALFGCSRSTPPLLGRWRSVPPANGSLDSAQLLEFEFEFTRDGGTTFTVVTPHGREESFGHWKLIRREGTTYHLEVVKSSETRATPLEIRVIDPQTFELADSQGRYHRYLRAPRLAAR